jgi:hypothetical protein
MREFAILGLLASVLVTACGDSKDLDPLVCDDTDWALDVVAGPSSTPLKGDVTVRGTASHPSAAIQSISVGGIAATNDAFNFSSWPALVPFGVLALAAADAGGDGSKATISVVARDACNSSKTTAVTFLINPHPAISVNRLAFDELTYPAQQSFLPADKSASAILTIRANSAAVGGTVMLHSTSGVTLSSSSLTLAGDSIGDATASVLVTGTSAGTSFITASSQAQTAQMPVAIAGPPTVVPDTATLARGQLLPITVTSAGMVQSCLLRGANDVAVSAAGIALGTTPLAVNVAKATYVFTLTAAAVTDAGAAPSTGTLDITCRDAFGQTGSSLVTLTGP